MKIVCSWPGVRLLDSGEVPGTFIAGNKGLAAVMQIIYCLKKNWLGVFRPAANLEPGERTGRFRLGKDDLIVDKDGDSRISVADFSVALIDELEQGTHHREGMTVGY